MDLSRFIKTNDAGRRKREIFSLKTSIQKSFSKKMLIYNFKMLFAVLK